MRNFWVLLMAGACAAPAEKGNDGGEEGSGGADETGVDGGTDGGEVPENLRVLRTAHGVVHVRAEDYRGLGFGVGHAWTGDNACLLAWRLAEVRGAISAQLGPDADVALPVHGMTHSSLSSDRFYRGWLDDTVIEAGFAAGAPEIRDLAAGYAEGVNHRLSQLGTIVGCELQVVEPVTTRDVYRMWVATALVASGELLSPFLAGSPPGGVPAVPPATATLPRERPFGSNALAVGRDLMAEGTGLLLYNPHFPWTGIHRVYLVDLEIPGELKVMGPALGGLPLPAAGFNAHVSWGLTFSNAARFTLAELPLVEGDPLRYTVDDEVQEITAEMLEIPVAGEDSPRLVPFYSSPAGPLLDAPAYRLGWTDDTAFATQDLNRDNTRFMEQLLDLARAETVAEIEESLGRLQGIPWSYVSAVDDTGEVLFAEVSRVPNVSDTLLDACNGSPAAEALHELGIFVLDGGRSACHWSGVMSPTSLPTLRRTDYVANSNNVHDLSNLDAPLVGFPRILGEEGLALALRPTLGLRMVEARRSGLDGLGAPGFSVENAEQMFLQTRGLAGELLAGPIAADCLADPVGSWRDTEVDLRAACDALAAWDGRYLTDSVGALVFAGLFTALREGDGTDAVFAVAPDVADPLHTPSGYTEDPVQRARVREALARVVLSLGAAGLAVDAPWGAGHCALTSSGCVGLPGSAGVQGAYDVLESDIGYGSYRGFELNLSGTPPESWFGASYLQVVGFGTEGPRARGLLAYGQATEADSPWVEDQVALHAAGAWFDFPFSEAQIQADPGLVDESP
jgi:acyl-homoserine-lactone acylase